MRHHAALATRIISSNRPAPRSDRDDFLAKIEHAMTTAGANARLLSDTALELLWRATRGVPRVASKLLRTSLILAHERDQSFVVDDVMTAAIDDLAVDRPTTTSTPAAPDLKPRRKTGTKSRD